MFAAAEVILHIAMAYDLYVAISKFLHYVTIMSRPVCACLVGATMILGFVHGGIQILFISHLPFCGPSVTHHSLCDLTQLLELSCTGTHTLGPLTTANTAALCSLTFSMLAVSYVIILGSMRTHGSEGCHKALSTCASHVTVVILFFVPCTYLYLRPMSSFPPTKL